MSAPEQQTTQPPASASSPTTYEDALRLFAEAYQDYVQAQQDSQLAAAKRHEDAYRSYLSAMQTIYEDVQQHTAEVYLERARVRQAMDATPGKDPETPADEANSGPGETMQTIQRDAQKRYENAYNDFLIEQQE